MSYAELREGTAARSRGRATKFTPECVQQIRDFLAQGETCEDIAAQIGVMVGTLKVNCSRLGISLRRPRSPKGLLPLKAARAEPVSPDTPVITLCLRYKGRERELALPLTPDITAKLAIEACFRNQKIAELMKDVLQTVIEKGLVHQLLKG
jgi:hypothetical protein